MNTSIIRHFPDARFAAPDPAGRALAVALSLSLCLHAVLLALNFRFPTAAPDHFSRPLEVVLVNSRSARPPREADALAQANLDGGGNTEAERRAQSPLPVVRDAGQREVSLASAARRVEELEAQAQKLLTQLDAKQSVEQTETRPQPRQETSSPLNAADLMQKSLEIARLEAQISRDWNSYQKRPQRLFVGARTREYALARYVDDWRIKVERVGNLNYPEAARQQKIYGSLLLTVSLNSDGSVENIEINRSSGSKILDSAALRIVQLAAPFSAFPEDIRKKADILSITRTWIFTRSDQLISE